MLGLLAQRHAAVDGRRRGCRARAPTSSNASVTCDAELARRARARAPPAWRRSGSSALDDRDRERERLAGAGRALGEDVAAAQRLGDRDALDRERACRCRARRARRTRRRRRRARGKGESSSPSNSSCRSRSRRRRRRRDLTGEPDCPPSAFTVPVGAVGVARLSGSSGRQLARLRAAAGGARAGRPAGRARPSRRA